MAWTKPKSYAKDFLFTISKSDNLSFEDTKIAYEMGNGTNATLKSF